MVGLLKKNGMLFLEIDNTQVLETKKLLKRIAEKYLNKEIFFAANIHSKHEI